MLISISHQNPTPLYEQIVSEVRRKILAGELKAGDHLPSIRQLAADLTTSVITTKRAYQELEGEGLIYTRAGMGSFVAEGSGVNRSALFRAELRQQLLTLCLGAAAQGVSAAELQQLLLQVIDEEGIW